MRYKGVIFDLDGVLCSTDKYHYQAWRQVAEELHIHFDQNINNKLRGVSRRESFEIILESNALILTEEKKERYINKKNEIYKKLLLFMSEKETDRVVIDTLQKLKEMKIKLAVGSSSKNAGMILDKLKLKDYFDVIVDGNNICNSKPDPEVFTKAGVLLNLPPKDCLVVEDAKSGVEAAKAAHMDCAALGDAARTESASYHLKSIDELLPILDETGGRINKKVYCIKTMKNKIKYACVGSGGIAVSKHLNGYSKLDNVEIIAICDPNQESVQKAAKDFAIPNIYGDVDIMLKNHKDLDIVSVCTPNFTHVPIAIKILENNMNVHCEKPVALNGEQAKYLLEAQKKSKKTIMVGLNNRFTNTSYYAKQCIENGLLGDIYHMKCGWRRRRGIPGKGSWFTNKQLSGGGPLIDLGVHYLDLAMYFLGFPKLTSVTGAIYSEFENNNSRNAWNYGQKSAGIYNVEDFAAGFLRTINGATIEFEFSWASNIEKEYNYYEILGNKGGICYKNNEMKIFTEQYGTCVDITPNLNYPHDAMNEFEHFCECVMKGKEPISKMEEAVQLMEIIDCIYESAEKKREVILYDQRGIG